MVDSYEQETKTSRLLFNIGGMVIVVVLDTEEMSMDIINHYH